jgi:hypothetical protein
VSVAFEGEAGKVSDDHHQRRDLAAEAARPHGEPGDSCGFLWRIEKSKEKRLPIASAGRLGRRADRFLNQFSRNSSRLEPTHGTSLPAKRKKRGVVDVRANPVGPWVGYLWRAVRGADWRATSNSVERAPGVSHLTGLDHHLEVLGEYIGRPGEFRVVVGSRAAGEAERLDGLPDVVLGENRCSWPHQQALFQSMNIAAQAGVADLSGRPGETNPPAQDSELLPGKPRTQQAEVNAGQGSAGGKPPGERGLKEVDQPTGERAEHPAAMLSPFPERLAGTGRWARV